MKPSRVLPALLLWAASVSTAFGDCSMGWVCVERETRADGTVLVATNLQPWPLTLSLRVEGAGVGAEPADEVTLSLAGHERRRAIALAPGAGGVRYRYDWTVGRTDARHDDEVVYRLPHASDESYPLLQGFGSSFSHTGLEEFTLDFDIILVISGASIDDDATRRGEFIIRS